MATSSKATGPGSGVRLVIVESPSKAKTISGFLGDGYIVESSVGHIRDLPRGAADVPAKYKGEPWARLGVDTDNGFEPLYVISPGEAGAGRQAQVAAGRRRPSSTSPQTRTARARPSPGTCWRRSSPRSRSSGWSSTRSPRPRSRPPRRTPAQLDDNLVDAQETRRILDRLYGYEVSPVLWKKVMPKLSAGRVQSVATRIIVQRERERMAFRDRHLLGSGRVHGADRARQPGVQVRRWQPSRAGGWPPAGTSTRPPGAIKAGTDVLLLDEDGARTLAAQLQGGTATVSSVEEKPYTRKPYPPFMTSTLQQEAGRKLGFNSERTMRTAQRLYENGYITYMRTDSTTLSADRAGGRPAAGPRAVRAGVRAGTRRGSTPAR